MTIANRIKGHAKDLGGFSVKRLLPAVQARAVGPFVFFDHMGPAEFPPGKGIDVRPHPHIGLATVTYLFEGEILHRDSLGSHQAIQPGAVNWMTAGRGIVHSERTAPDVRARGHRLHGIQTWVALPAADEEVAPSFHHHPAASLPVIEADGVRLRVILGDAFGRRAPVHVFSPVFYADVEWSPGAQIAAPADYAERALYVVQGTLHVGGHALGEGEFVTFTPGTNVEISAASNARAMLLGGAPLDGPRHMVWNFVSSRLERIEQAKRDWSAQAMGEVPGETEFIPYP